jgi:hypothetical protein
MSKIVVVMMEHPPHAGIDEGGARILRAHDDSIRLGANAAPERRQQQQTARDGSTGKLTS